MVSNLNELVDNYGYEATYQTLAEQTVNKLCVNDLLKFATAYIVETYFANPSVASNDFALHTDNDFEDKVESKLRERAWV